MQLSDISDKFTNATLDEIIQKAGGTKCTGWSFGSGFKKGDFYLSEVFRLKVEGEDANGQPLNVNLVVKALPKKAARRKLFRSDIFFRNEINFYKKVLPAFEKFQKGTKAKNPFNEYPQYYASHCDGVNDFLALRDISELGYGAASRQETIDYEHCAAIMKSLGRFHAVSLAFKDQQPDEFTKVAQSIEETYYNDKFRAWYTPFLKDAIKVAEHAVSTEFPGTVYEEKSKKFLHDDVFQVQINLVERKNKYSVIQHGDCWMPNFLFRYNENKVPEHVKIIDFQLARYASPAVDLSFFTYSCTDNKMRTQYYDSMLKIYHEAAADLIKDLGSDPDKVFPYEGLLNEMKEVGKFGCGMGIESLPLSMQEEHEVLDIDEIATDQSILTDVWQIAPLEDKNSRLRLAEAFKHAIDMGYIE